MHKTIEFYTEGYICDCGKEWPEEMEVCPCGKPSSEIFEAAYENEPRKLRPEYKDRFPYLEPFTFNLPAEWVVCYCCNGRGTTAFGYSGREQIAWTQSEWAEEDPDFREDYIAGHYDKPCPECNGRTTVLEIDEKRLDKVQQKVYDIYCAHMERSYYDDAIAEAERRFGC